MAIFSEAVIQLPPEEDTQYAKGWGLAEDARSRG